MQIEETGKESAFISHRTGSVCEPVTKGALSRYGTRYYEGDKRFDHWKELRKVIFVCTRSYAGTQFSSFSKQSLLSSVQLHAVMFPVSLITLFWVSTPYSYIAWLYTTRSSVNCHLRWHQGTEMVPRRSEAQFEVITAVSLSQCKQQLEMC